MLTIAVSLFIYSATFGQSGKVMESLKFQSKLMGKDVNYSIYLPPDYETSNRNYPVVYLLHGYTDDDTGWLQFGELLILQTRRLQTEKSHQ